MAMELVVPSLQHLDGYVDALRRGWSPDNIRLEAAAREHLAQIETDAAGFLARTQDREARGGDLLLPDGTTVRRLPNFARWMWDGAFCGQIGFRWQPGTEALPAHVLGHIGYAVVPWKRRLGYASHALALMLPEARREGLAWVELTTDTGNEASQRVILANGGHLLARFVSPGHGAEERLRYRIDL
jgi:predicted acetyltransferase